MEDESDVAIRQRDFLRCMNFRSMWLQMANTCETIRPQKSDPILSDHKELKADGFYVLGKFWPKEVRE